MSRWGVEVVKALYKVNLKDVVKVQDEVEVYNDMKVLNCHEMKSFCFTHPFGAGYDFDMELITRLQHTMGGLMPSVEQVSFGIEH